jgi:molecular chaperone Hsp33
MTEDLLLRASAGDGFIRAFFASMKNTVEEARRVHNTSPTATAALGRLLTAALIMGQTLKDDGELITLQIKCDGPVGGLLATAGNTGRVKGYAVNPAADVPSKPGGKLDVAGIILPGELTVIRDLGLKGPYSGKLPLVSGEIAEDLAHYYARSEQTPSAVALGVLVDRDISVRQAGGFLIQMLPGAPDGLIDALERKIAGISSVTSMLDAGMDAEGLLRTILGEFGVQIYGETPVMYKCDCSYSRVERVIVSLGRADVEKILAESGRAEINCHFCGKNYVFERDGLEKILRLMG